MLGVSYLDFALAIISSFMLGISKSGIKGFGVAIIATMALVFGAKESTGIVVPLLVVGDILAVIFYTKYVNWRVLLKTIPFIFIGLLIGAIFGNEISEVLFRKIMAIVILVSILGMIILDLSNKKIPQSKIFMITTGMLSGFATIIGNLSGAVINFFFLALKFDKYSFIGTAAMLYFLTNLLKLPIHIWYWKTISYHSFYINLYLIPFLIIGFFTGRFLVKKIKSDHYRNYIIGISILGGLLLFFK